MTTSNRGLPYVSQMKKKLQQQLKKQTNIKGGKQKNTKTFQKINCTLRTTTMNAISKKYQKHKSHEKQWQNNSEINNNILRMQQDTNENNETTVNETENDDKNSVRNDIINLKNDMQEIKEALKRLLTKQ